MPPINKKQIAIGIITLALGLLVYLIDRPPDDTYLVYRICQGINLYNIAPNLFGPVGNVLPAFVHVFSFSLITAGLLGSGKRGCLVICSTWLAIDLGFEFGQKFDSWASHLFPDNFSGIPFLEAGVGYFKFGTFDYLDLAAITLGSIAALSIIRKTMSRRENSGIR